MLLSLIGLDTDSSFLVKLGTCLSGIAIALITFFIKRSREALLDYIKNICVKYLSVGHKFEHKIAENDCRINDILVELRTILDSERVGINLFHNGSTFTLQNPVWRISTCYENCKFGTSYEANNFQNIMISHISDIVAPLLSSSNITENYVHSIHCNKCHNYKICSSTKRFFSYSVDDMPPNSSKYILTSRGVTSIICIGLYNNNVCFGYIYFEYCGIPLNSISSNLMCDVSKLTDIIRWALLKR